MSKLSEHNRNRFQVCYLTIVLWNLGQDFSRACWYNMFYILYFRCMPKPLYWISFLIPWCRGWVTVECIVHTTLYLSYCLFSSCLEGEIGWSEMYGVGVSEHIGGKQVNGCMPSLNNKTWKCLTWIVKVFEFQQLHELCWRTSTWKWDWKNLFTILGSDLSLCASRGGYHGYITNSKFVTIFCFCCWFRRRLPS